MKFDGVNIIEEGNEVFIAYKNSNKVQPEINEIFEEEEISNKFDNTPVDPQVILNRDINRNFEEKVVNNKNVVLVNIENASLTFALKFRTFLGQSIKRKAKDIIVDLSYVKRIDSTFIGVLVEGLKKTTRYGGNIVLVTNTNLMISSFVLLSLDIFFTSFNNLKDTMQYFEDRINEAAWYLIIII